MQETRLVSSMLQLVYLFYNPLTWLVTPIYLLRTPYLRAFPFIPLVPFGPSASAYPPSTFCPGVPRNSLFDHPIYSGLY